MSRVHAVIIAGGQGRRLGGVRKAELRIGGCPLLGRVATALGPVQHPLLVSIGPWQGWGALPHGAMAVPDLVTPLGGPLAGLAAAVEALQRQGIGEGLLVSVAVDTPFLPTDFVAVMGDGLGEAPAAYAAWGGQWFPPNAIWQLGALADLPRQARENAAPRSLRALQETLGARAIEWTGRAAQDPFASVNTMADLVALGRRAREPAASPLIHSMGN